MKVIKEVTAGKVPSKVSLFAYGSVLKDPLESIKAISVLTVLAKWMDTKLTHKTKWPVCMPKTD